MLRTRTHLCSISLFGQRTPDNGDGARGRVYIRGGSYKVNVGVTEKVRNLARVVLENYKRATIEPMTVYENQRKQTATNKEEKKHREVGLLVGKQSESFVNAKGVNEEPKKIGCVQ